MTKHVLHCLSQATIFSLYYIPSGDEKKNICMCEGVRKWSEGDISLLPFLLFSFSLLLPLSLGLTREQETMHVKWAVFCPYLEEEATDSYWP